MPTWLATALGLALLGILALGLLAGVGSALWMVVLWRRRARLSSLLRRR